MILNTQLIGATLFQKLVSFLLLSIISSTLFAQSYQAGFVITETGDSLRGYVLFKDHTYNRQNCRFKTTQEGPVLEFLASEIEAYGIDGIASFRSASRSSDPSQKVFLEYILRGAPSLLYYGSTYFIESGNQVEELIYKIETLKKGEKVYQKEVETFKSQLLDYFTSCPDLSAAVLSSRYDSKSLTKLFSSYHECAGTSSESFISEGNLIQIKWGAGVKAQRNTLNAKRLAGSTFYFETSDAKWDPFFSPFFAVHLSYPRINGRLALRSGIAFHRYSYSNSEVNDRAGVDLFYEMDISTSQIELPLEVIYNLGKTHNKLAPYVFVGTGMNFLLTLTGDRKTSTLNDLPLSRNEFSGRGSSFMLRGGFGATLTMGNSLSLFTELFAENSNGFIVPDDNDVIINRKALGLSIGVYFK